MAFMIKIFNDNPLIKGISLTIFSYFFLSIGSVFVKLTSSNFSIWQILFWQNLICLLLTLIYFKRKKILSFEMQKTSAHLYRAFFGISCYWAFYKSLTLLDLVDATVITYTAPFFIPFISFFWVKEPLEKGIWWAIVLGFLGMVFILKPTNHFVMGAGFLIALLAAITTAASIVSIRVLNIYKETLSSMLIYFFLFGTGISLIFSLHDWVWPTGKNLFFILGVGVSTFLGQILINYAYRFGTAAFLSPLCYFIVIFNFIFSWIVFQDIPQWNAFVGSIFIILGGSMSFASKAKTKALPEFFSRKNIETHWWNRFLKK
jgi:drug/metabolite transporter (DMT)-like permease